MQRCTSKRGFTLLELLVVIAVIAILISILIPAVRRIRAAGERTYCAANIRSILQAMHMYAAAHKDFIVGGPYSSGAFLYVDVGYPRTDTKNRFSDKNCP